MDNADIKHNIESIFKEIPENVELVAAAKTRSPEEIKEALAAGVKVIGENYVQEGVEAFNVIGNGARWHFIGHLQKNKVKKAVEIFDVIETVDSFKLAEEIDKKCCSIDKVISVFIEINSGREDQKFGVHPEKCLDLVEKVSLLSNLKVTGLMTMGPFTGDPELARPYFIETRKVFDRIMEKDILGVELKYLSMGMTNSYMVAIEEGANLIRIGTKIFGERR